MAVTTHTLSGTLQTADGLPVPAANVQVHPVAADRSTLRIDGAVIIPEPVIVTTDLQGRFTVSLLPRSAYKPVPVFYKVMWVETKRVAGREVSNRIRVRLISMPDRDADLADPNIQVTIGTDDDGLTVIEVPTAESYDDLTGAPDVTEPWPTATPYADVPDAPDVSMPWPGGGGGGSGTVAYSDVTGAPATNLPWPTATPYAQVPDAPSVAQIWPGGSYADITGAPVVTQPWPTPPAYSAVTGKPSIPQVTVLTPQTLTAASSETLEVGGGLGSMMPDGQTTVIPVTSLGSGSLASNLDGDTHRFTLAAGSYIFWVHLSSVWNTSSTSNALQYRSTIAVGVTGTLPAGSAHSAVPHYFRGAIQTDPAEAASQGYLYLPEATEVGLALVGYPGVGEDSNSQARNCAYRAQVDSVVFFPIGGVTVT